MWGECLGELQEKLLAFNCYETRNFVSSNALESFAIRPDAETCARDRLSAKCAEALN